MRKNPTRWLAAALAACLAGCVTTDPVGSVPAPELPPPVASSPAGPAPAALPETLPRDPPGDVPLTLENLLVMAEKHHPVLVIARSRIEAPRGRLIQVGLYPNPSVTPRIDELGNSGNAGGMPALTMTQEIVTAKKLKLAQSAARFGVEAADWQALTDYYDLRGRVRAAYYELLAAGGEVAANKEIVRITEAALEAAKKLQKAGTGTRPDLLRAEVESEQSKMRLAVSERRLEAAGRLLAAAVGVPALPCGPDGPLVVGTLERPAPLLEWHALIETVKERSSELMQAQAVVRQTQGLLARAEAEVCPNITVTWRPIWNTIDKDFESLLEIGAPIPIWNRNQGNIRAARAEVARSVADVHQVELRLTERLTAAYQRYRAARRQVTAYRERIVPGAQEALKLVGLGYEKGDPKYDFTTFLQAEQTLAKARLASVQVGGDLWRALAEIRALTQVDTSCEE